MGNKITKIITFPFDLAVTSITKLAQGIDKFWGRIGPEGPRLLDRAMQYWQETENFAKVKKADQDFKGMPRELIRIFGIVYENKELPRFSSFVDELSNKIRSTIDKAEKTQEDKEKKKKEKSTVEEIKYMLAMILAEMENVSVFYNQNNNVFHYSICPKSKDKGLKKLKLKELPEDAVQADCCQFKPPKEDKKEKENEPELTNKGDKNEVSDVFLAGVKSLRKFINEKK